MSQTSEQNPGDYLLHVDRVGSFRLIISNQILVGGPAGKFEPGRIKMLGSLSTDHTRLQRYEHGFSICPLKGPVVLKILPAAQQSSLGGGQIKNHETMTERLLISETLLTNNTCVGLDQELELNWRIPSTLCQSACLHFSPAERLKERVENILWMDQLLLLGPGPHSHIPCHHWPQAGVLIYQAGRFRFRSPAFSARGGQKENSQNIDLELSLNRYYQQAEMAFYLEPTGKFHF